VTPKEDEYQTYVPTNFKHCLVLEYDKQPYTLVLIDYMHTGGEDRLRNRSFSEISGLCDLWTGHTAHLCVALIDLYIYQISFKSEKKAFCGRTYGRWMDGPASLGQLGGVEST